MSALIDNLRGVQGPDAATIAQSLPDTGEGLSAQLAALARDPTARGCELLAVNLEGARQAVMRLAAELRKAGP